MQMNASLESNSQEEVMLLEETGKWIKHLQWLGINVEKPEGE